MRHANGTLSDLTIALNQTITELSAPISPASGSLASATSQVNLLLVWRGSSLAPANGTLAGDTTTYNAFVDEEFENMATLPEEDRKKVWRGVMRYWSSNHEITGGTGKADLLTAVGYTDGWIEANQAAWNGGLPTSVKNNLTTAQKTLLFCAVALARVSIAFLRQIFGEVD